MPHLNPSLGLALALFFAPLAVLPQTPAAPPCPRADFAKRSTIVDGVRVSIRLPALSFNGLILTLENTLDTSIPVDLCDLQVVGPNGQQALLLWVPDKPPFTLKLAPGAKIELSAHASGGIPYPARIRFGAQDLATVTN